jgi:hypothetical protein
LFSNHPSFGAKSILLAQKKCLVKPPFLLGKIAIFDYSKIHVPSSWFRQPSPRGTAPLVNSERLL